MACQVSIRVNHDDYDRFTKDFRKYLMDTYPELHGLRMSQSFLFHKLIQKAEGLIK